MDKSDWYFLISMVVLLPTIIKFILGLFPNIQGKITMADRIRNITIPVLVILSLCLSGLGWYYSHHQLKELKPEELTKVSGKTFVNQTVDIDGMAYENCKFVNVKLMFHGKKSFLIAHDDFVGPLAITTDNDQARMMMEIIVTILRDAGFVDVNSVGYIPNSNNEIIMAKNK